MSIDAPDHHHPDWLEALANLSAKLHIIADDRQLDRTPAIRQQIRDVAEALAQIFSVDECTDVDTVADIDSFSNGPVNARTVGNAFARPVRSTVNTGNAKRPRADDTEQVEKARTTFDAWGGAAMSGDKRRECELEVAHALKIERRKVTRWFDYFIKS
ncbi:hypothetical protein BJG93_02220 [Paraburkholderia sprentiae WSM5005]|uniref:Uncharacterized protein n=1 Tax=Paraburkholderia sprentiae WSM5005 TaxID=754502 RepID=A0A1I9YDF7_9BURK|nr:hypothetical protein [Paraburkholderia sprentiae]APA84340.2 hypothetical protein BJG93_02220 [Paraburkholderia sprentiae WSM5005]